MPLLPGLVQTILQRYAARTPTAVAVYQLLNKLTDGRPLVHDHMAFRTLGVENFGNDSIAKAFRDMNYVQKEPLTFPNKKVNAMWYSAPRHESQLPRLFVSELQVAELSKEAQEILSRYQHSAGGAYLHGAVCATTGALPWATPELSDYEALMAESEFAAWTLVNGYNLSHSTVSVHSLGLRGGIEELTERLEKEGFKLNTSGGSIKVSPDGGLLQSSTISDRVPFKFAGGQEREVSGAYIEFAERKPLPEFEGLPEEELQEHHRRDGFEQTQADLIFDSTSEGGTEISHGKYGSSRVMFDNSEDNVDKEPVRVAVK